MRAAMPDLREVPKNVEIPDNREHSLGENKAKTSAKKLAGMFRWVIPPLQNLQLLGCVLQI